MLSEHPCPSTEQDGIALYTTQVQTKPQLDCTQSGDLQRNPAGTGGSNEAAQPACMAVAAARWD